MKIFNLREYNVIVEPEVLLVPEFKAVWDKDKTKHKEEAYKWFSYIYMTCDIASPYSNLPHHKRELEIKKAILRDEKIKIPDYIEVARKKYIELSELPTQRLLDTVNFKLDEIDSYLRNTEFNEDNADTQNKIMERIAKYIGQREVLEDAVSKEKSKGTVRRGGKSTRLFESRDSMNNIGE